MIATKKVIALQESLLAGAGKLSIRTNENGESNVAVVHQNAIEVLLLDKEGRVARREQIHFDDLFGNQLTETRILWSAFPFPFPSSSSSSSSSSSCNDPFLIVWHCNQLFKLISDSRRWTVAKEIFLGHDANTLTNALVTHGHSIYTGTGQGLWEIDSDLQCQSQLTKSSTIAISVTDNWLAVAVEQGEIILWRGGAQQWSQYSQRRAAKDAIDCCTSLLIPNKPQGVGVVIAAYSTGSIRLYSLCEKVDLIAEIAAHIRWISQLLPCSDSGFFLSASEDSFIHLWQLERANATDDDDGKDAKEDLRYVDSLQLEDHLLLSGAAINSNDGSYLFAVYDRPQLYHITVRPTPN